MQLGMIGLGRMGANMVRRLIGGGHECVVFDMSPQAVADLAKEGAIGTVVARGLREEARQAARDLAHGPGGRSSTSRSPTSFPLLDKGDILIDGGNSYYVDDLRRAKELAAKGIHYVDVGTSGGVWGLERGYCMMIGGEGEVVKRLDPILSRLAPGRGDVPGRPDARRPAEPRRTGTSTAGRTARATSSRWSTTASSTA